MSEPPATINYTIVVPREICLTLADMNELPVQLVDIQNAYITAPVTDKIWKVLVQEFGEDSGKKVILVW